MNKIGTYVGIQYNKDSITSLVRLQHILGLKNPVSNVKFHTTLVYHRGLIDFEIIDSMKVYLRGYRLGVLKSKDGNNCVVLYVKNHEEDTYLMDRFNYSLNQGAIWDYDEYRPHITLSYDEKNIDTPLIQYLLDKKDLNIMVVAINEFKKDITYE
jgi:hypothetical protein